MGSVDQKKLELRRLFDDSDYLRLRVESYNIRATELNEKTIRIMKVSQVYGSATLDDIETAKNLGTLDQLDIKWNYDPPTDELLRKIRKDNEEILRKEFPDLYQMQEILKIVNNDQES